MSSKSRLLLAFALAVGLTSLLASVFQTQSNLAALQELGAPVPVQVRLLTTGHDLLGFAPLFALLCALAFAVALPAAVGCALRLPTLRWPIFALAGALAIWCVLALANALAPMPTLVAADRNLPGTLGLMLCGSLGALLFAWLAPQRHSHDAVACDGLS
ncbi:hypothetical protein [Pseudomonas sp. NCCP-436]|uniref:hypothetical protein n=1 Tax=Pseudomonas sp. NCCP-436 TaxID=2842481 RepID=UPI001C80F2B4|nr:hypothetical protein [Pseudomonas sp. NCCP-436]GIZ10947.1 hypothetical protein NCCP436_03630 [Pseudomonas sp. NCCP-436]